MSSPQIGIDASAVVGRRTGIGCYTAELLTGLGRIWPEAWPPARVWVNSRRHPLPANDPWHSSPAFSTRRTRIPGRVLLRSWQYLRWPPVERLAGPLDLIHSPASYIPPTRRARRLITIHDVYFKHAPDHVEPYGGRYFLNTFERGLPALDHVIAVSRFTRDEFLRHYPIDPDRITVVPHGVDFDRFHERAEAADDACLTALGIEPPYFFCVATIEPRKNLGALVEAYAKARQIARTDAGELPRLIIAGQQGWDVGAFEARLDEARLRDRIQLTGYVPNAALPALYRQALGFIFPSLYEGFGLPVLEAMACGCPTLISQTASLPEVAGEAAAYFDPKDTSSIANVLARFVTDPSMRNSLREAGLKQVRSFDWATTARKTLEVYKRVMDLD